MPTSSAPTRRRHAATPAAAILALTLLLAACAGGDAADEMATATETLPDGGTLVRHSPPPDGLPVTWRLEEELRIGTMDGGGPAQLGRAAGLAVAEDGRIVVLDGQAQDIRVFDDRGENLVTLGGRGRGPGELEGANGVVLGPDGVLRVPDGRNNRLSYFDLDTGFIRSHPYQPLYLTWMFDGVLDDQGTFWAIHQLPPPRPGESSYVAYVGYDSAGQPVDTLVHPEAAREPGRNDPGSWTVERDGRLMARLGVPYYPRQQHLLDRRLRTWTTLEGDPSYLIERRTSAGEPDLSIRTERPLQPPNRAAADSIVAGWEEDFDMTLDRSKIPDLAPAINSFFMDDDARLWVDARTPDTDSIRTFDAYDSDDGRWLGTLATPLPIVAHPRPVIRGDKLWAVIRDELDVPYIIRARLVGVDPPADG